MMSINQSHFKHSHGPSIHQALPQNRQIVAVIQHQIYDLLVYTGVKKVPFRWILVLQNVEDDINWFFLYLVAFVF